jgi:spore coat protein CotH
MISKKTKYKENPKTRNYDLMINDDEYFTDAQENNKGGVLYEIDNES